MAATVCCPKLLLTVVLLYGCITSSHSQLTVLTGPEALISSSGRVVEGSVIQIYCTVENDTTVTFTWTLNGSSLLNDLPHIRIREDNLPERSASLLTDDSTSVLTVDNFRASDNGVYQCTATSGATSGNGNTVTLTAVPSTADGTLMLTNQPSLNEPVDLSPSLNDNRTGIALGGTVDDSLLTCTAGHQGDGVMNYSAPSVVWVRSGQVVNDTDSRITITSTTMVNGQATSSLTITNFGLPDAGVYQCVFNDDSDDGEVITSIPYQLDTGNTIHLERVSPEVIILRPPEKLVIEVRVSGEYEVLFWNKGTVDAFIPGQMRPQEFPNYFETFVRDNTTADDEGFYVVVPQLKMETTQTHIITPLGGVDFGVIAPVDANTTSLSNSIVVIFEGGSADISCRSVGAPVPSITWEFNNQTTGFKQTDTETPFVATLTGTISDRGTEVTPGNIESSLHILSTTYPNHDGVYTCIGTNSDDLIVASSSAFITVQVNVIPEVEINTTDTLVGIGNDVTINCFVLRGNPSNYMYTITNINTSSTTTGSTRILTDIQMTDVGTYRCDVTNDAGTGSSNTVTIELGDPPVVTTIQPDSVILNTTIDLICVVTGDTPIEIVWERFDVASTAEVVYTGNDTIGGNFSLIASTDNYGIYRCNATSRFGMDSSSIVIVQAVGPTFLADNADIEFVVGSTLTLTVTITDFNLPLIEITWFIDGVPATAVIGRTGVLTITNTSTTSPPATTTLTLDPVQLPSESRLYSVTAVNPAGMDTTTFNVTITAPANITFPADLVDLLVSEGNQTTLTCSARGSPAPVFVWYRGSEVVDIADARLQISTMEMSNVTTGFIYVTSLLNITQVNRTDVGMFRCEASNTILGAPSTDSQSYNLTVNFSPTILEDPVPVSVFAPIPLTLTCTAEGYPRPTIVWTRTSPTGEETEFSLPMMDNVYLTETANGLNVTSNLTILVTDELNTGNWSCRANNNFGEAVSRPAEVVIYFGAQIVSPMSGEIFRVNETENITFTCVAIGLPPPSISFFNGDQLLGLPRFIVETQPAELLPNTTFLVTASLTLINATDGDSGDKGICRAMNTVEEPNETKMDAVSIEVVVNVAPSITVSPMDISVISPDPALFSCTADGVPTPTISWLRVDNGTEVDVTTDSNVQISNAPINRTIVSNLTFNEAQPVRSGVYICVASNLLGSATEMAQLTVNDLPRILTPVINFTYTVNEDDPVTFNCSASGIPAPIISWFRVYRNESATNINDTRFSISQSQVDDNYELPDGRGTGFLVTSQLAISITQDEDSGQYQCLAENDVGNTTREFELVVQIDPEFTMDPDDVDVTERMSAPFLCAATGRPRPSITWYRDDTNDSLLAVNVSDPRVIVTETEMGERELISNLTINDVLPSDSNVYRCIAENDVDSDMRNATLTVNVLPVVTIVYPEVGLTSYTVNETDSIIFECTATGIPAPEIDFDFGNITARVDVRESSSPVEETRIQDGETVYQVTRTAMINRTMDSDSGVYMCVANNDIGMDQESFELIVQVSPTITQSPVDVTVIAGNNAVFVCQASALPEPAVNWNYYNPVSNSTSRVMNGADYEIMEAMDGNRVLISNLTVLSTDVSDFGEYRCTAINVVGMVSATASLSVHVRPLITSLEPGNMSVVNQTDPATFVCTATGLPTPLVQWYRGDLLLNGTGMDINSRVELNNTIMYGSLGQISTVISMITITDTIGGDSDTYSCVASNALINNGVMEDGRDQQDVTLFVQVPPEVTSLDANQRITANEAESATLGFSIENASPVVMVSNIRWYYSANFALSLFASGSEFQEITSLSSRTSKSTLTFSSDRLTLIIDNIVQARMAGEETDAGRYFLQATNEAGSDNSYIDIVVNGPPVIIDPPMDQFIINNGSSAVFSCDALAFPDHNVSWTFTDFNETVMDIVSNIKYTIVSDRNESRFGELTVVNVTYEDRGVYTCSAANTIGTVNASGNLTVHVTPVIVDTSALTEVQLGVPAVLVCLVTGLPIPSISWRKDGEIVNIYSDSSLLARLDVVEFAAVSVDGNSSAEFESSGYTGSGSIMGLLMMYTDVTVDQVRQLGELGVVGLLSFENTVRGDTGDYTCTGTNMLPETTTLSEVSNNIPLFILERPDSPSNVSTRGDVGARWVVLSWIPSFDGNRLVTNFSLYIRSVDVSDSFTLISTLIPSDLINSAGELMYNISMQGVILPYTNYSFTVDACNDVGCSNQSDPSPVVMTDQGAASPPNGLTVEPTQTSITLTWTEPDMPHGVITHYEVSFVGTRDYNASFSHTDSMQLPIGDIYSPVANNFGTTLTGLFPNTQYTVSVYPVNGAGNGMPNTRTVITLNAPPPPPDNEPSSVSEEEIINSNPQTVTIGVPLFSEDSVVISHYQVIVVFLPEGTAISDLNLDSKVQFPQQDLGSHADFSCNSKPSFPDAYVTAEMSGDLYKGLTGDKFVVGQDNDDDLNSPNDRPDRYTNGPLCFATSYTFFVRAFSASALNQMGRRAVRQADPDNRQYDDFASSGYVQSTAEIPADPTTNTTTIIVAIIVVLLVIIVVVVVVVVIIIFVRRGRKYEYKTNNETDNGNGVETLKLTDYRPPDEGSVVRHPIPLSVLSSHCERMHTNENCGFGEEYRIIQEKSPKNAVDICTTPDNKPRNRYANIQCFDETRVVLTSIEGAEHDYINANFIAGYNRPREYIAAQGPLPDTLGDFWRMVWDYDIPTIVMLTNLVEKMKIKCSQYWPNAGHQQYASIDVSLVNTVTQSDFVIRHFHIKQINSEEVKEVRQFHFVSWPDFGVPRHPTPLLHFLRRVRNMHSYSNERPLLIHCSAGVGRTGTMVTIDVELQRAMQEGVVDPFNYVTKLRDQRNHMVQTEAQYVFLHDAIMEGITSGATEIRVEKLVQKYAELEQADAEGETGFQKEYGRLRQFKVDVKEFTDANDDANKFKNRISNALPYNYNRVHLQMSPGVGGSDYINASYIDGYSNKATYIATQGPLLNTLNDFWRLVWEKEVHVIVMLTQLEEKGQEQCAQYWPEAVNSTEKMGSLTVELVNSNQYEDYVLRELKVSDVTATDGKSRTLKQYHFIAWPAEGAPMSGAGMIDLIDQVNRTQSHTGNKPILVHCSAGIGRTGAFCALSTSIDRVKTEGLVDVFHCVKHLRTQRPHMVQSVEQYAFCYVAIREYVESLNSYSNFQ